VAVRSPMWMGGRGEGGGVSIELLAREKRGVKEKGGDGDDRPLLSGRGSVG
jgi:hypothetical protein